MKKLSNPKLNFRQEAIVIDSSSNEETEIVKQGSRSKGKSIAKPSSFPQPAKKKRSQLAREIEQSKTNLSEIVLEIRNKISKQQQDEEARMCPFESQDWEDEDEQILREAGILEGPGVSADYTDFLMKEESISEIPNFDEEDVQESI